MSNPLVFVSCVSEEFRTTRRKIAEVLIRLGYTPVTQEILGTEAGDLRAVLRQKIDACMGLVQIVGDAYGMEPVFVDEEFGRVSYTQFEYLYARRQNKKVWLLFAGDMCNRDTPIEKLDLPRRLCEDAASFQEERHNLQQAYRDRVARGNDLYHSASNDSELILCIERMRDELHQLRVEELKWREQVLEEQQELRKAIFGSRATGRSNRWFWIKCAFTFFVMMLITALMVEQTLKKNQNATPLHTSEHYSDLVRLWSWRLTKSNGSGGGMFDNTYTLNSIWTFFPNGSVVAGKLQANNQAYQDGWFDGTSTRSWSLDDDILTTKYTRKDQVEKRTYVVKYRGTDKVALMPAGSEVTELEFTLQHRVMEWKLGESNDERIVGYMAISSLWGIPLVGALLSALWGVRMRAQAFRIAGLCGFVGGFCAIAVIGIVLGFDQIISPHERSSSSPSLASALLSMMLLAIFAGVGSGLLAAIARTTILFPSPRDKSE